MEIHNDLGIFNLEMFFGDKNKDISSQQSAGELKFWKDYSHLVWSLDDGTIV